MKNTLMDLEGVEVVGQGRVLDRELDSFGGEVNGLHHVQHRTVGLFAVGTFGTEDVHCRSKKA